MILPMLLSCGRGDPPVSTVQGLQIVAIEAVPPNPRPDQPVLLRMWVADALGLGADVALWACTPLLGACIESFSEDGGVTLDQFTATGTTTRVFEAVVPWPSVTTSRRDALLGVLASLEEQGEELPIAVPSLEEPELLVWGLACAPGRCDVFDRLEAHPTPGSEPWQTLVADLADPRRLIEGVPPRQASVALKTVPLWTADPFTTTTAPPDNVPLLVEVAPTSTGTLDTGFTPNVSVDPRAPHAFDWADVDGDDVGFQAFTTSGNVDLSEPEPGRVVLTHRPTYRGGAPDLYLVGEDGRGGTVVWSTHGASDGGQCGEPTVTLLDFATGVPIAPYDPFLVQSAGYAVWNARIEGLRVDSVTSELRGDDGALLAQGFTALYATGECGSQGAALVSFSYGLPCSLGGRVVHLVTRLSVGGATSESDLPVILQLGPYTGCAP